MPHNGSPQEWLTRAQAGDGSARGRLLGWLCRQVRPWAQRRPPLASRQMDASDLAQEVCLRVHNTFDRVVPDCQVPQLLGFARTILHNLVTDQGRQQEIRLRADAGIEDVVGDGTAPDEQAVRRERAALLEQALQRLPEQQRLAFQLRLHEGLTFAEMGQRLDTSLNRAHVLFLRAATALQTLTPG